MALQHLYMGRVMWHPGMWMNSLCQLLPIGFCGVVYELGKGQLSSSTTLLTQCFRKKPEEIFMALDFNFLGKPSSASPAPHGNTASIPTEGHDLHWHLYVTVPATRYPLGGSFVHTGTYVPTTLFCCKSPTEVTPPSCWQRLVTQFRLILNSPRPGSPGMPPLHPLIPLLTIPVSQTVQPRKPPLVPTTCPLLFLLTWWAW